MRRFWMWLGLNLGKHARLVGVAGLAVTVVLAVGIARLEFATGQDSYLNEDEEVYQDNLAYQRLFGGQAMVTLFTMDDGSDVVDLFTAENIEHLRRVEDQLSAIDGVMAVVTPLTALEFTESMVESPTGDITESVAGQALLGALAREPDPLAEAIRREDAAATLARYEAVSEDRRTFDNPEWIRFLLFDNRGEIRKSLRPFFPDEGHAQMVTRLVGNASIEEEGVTSEAVQAITLEHPTRTRRWSRRGRRSS